MQETNVLRRRRGNNRETTLTTSSFFKCNSIINGDSLDAKPLQTEDARIKQHGLEPLFNALMEHIDKIPYLGDAVSAMQLKRTDGWGAWGLKQLARLGVSAYSPIIGTLFMAESVASIPVATATKNISEEFQSSVWPDFLKFLVKQETIEFIKGASGEGSITPITCLTNCTEGHAKLAGEIVAKYFRQISGDDFGLAQRYRSCFNADELEGFVKQFVTPETLTRINDVCPLNFIGALPDGLTTVLGEIHGIGGETCENAQSMFIDAINACRTQASNENYLYYTIPLCALVLCMLCCLCAKKSNSYGRGASVPLMAINEPTPTYSGCEDNQEKINITVSK